MGSPLRKQPLKQETVGWEADVPKGNLVLIQTHDHALACPHAAYCNSLIFYICVYSYRRSSEINL